MMTLLNTAPAVETRPATKPSPREALPDNPDDPLGVDHKIIEEIEEIGRRYIEPRR